MHFWKNIEWIKNNVYDWNINYILKDIFLERTKKNCVNINTAFTFIFHSSQLASK